MSEIILVPLEAISGQNEAFTGIVCDAQRKEALKGCYSSFHYYESAEERICSIVMSLVKDHFFIDGNKRTALFCYLMLAQLNGLSFIDNEDEQAETFIGLAASHKSVKQAVKILFPG